MSTYVNRNRKLPDTRQNHSYYGRRIGNRTLSFEWYQFE